MPKVALYTYKSRKSEVKCKQFMTIAYVHMYIQKLLIGYQKRLIIISLPAMGLVSAVH